MSSCVIVWLKVFVSGLSTWLFPLSQSLKAILISRLCRLPQIFWQLTSPAVHKVPVPFCHYFQWTIHFITPFFIFIFSRELFHSSSVTVTQGPLRTSLVPKLVLHLLFAFELLMIRSLNCVLWTFTLFSLTF